MPIGTKSLENRLLKESIEEKDDEEIDDPVDPVDTGKLDVGSLFSASHTHCHRCRNANQGCPDFDEYANIDRPGAEGQHDEADERADRGNQAEQAEGAVKPGFCEDAPKKPNEEYRDRDEKEEKRKKKTAGK